MEDNFTLLETRIAGVSPKTRFMQPKLLSKAAMPSRHGKVAAAKPNTLRVLQKNSWLKRGGIMGRSDPVVPLQEFFLDWVRSIHLA